MSSSTLKPAAELARASKVHFPNESAEYRRGREALLIEEIELRRHIARVAELRRALPPGGEVKKRYTFDGESGKLTLADLFGDKQTLVIYNYMFGPQRENGRPMCTSFMSTWAARHRAAHRVCFRRAFTDRTIDRGEEGARLDPAQGVLGYVRRLHPRLCQRRGRRHARLNVFARKDGAIRHFWAGEMGGGTADPGQDPRGAPDLDPLWAILDTTPEGRGTDWYPKLSY